MTSEKKLARNARNRAAKAKKVKMRSITRPWQNPLPLIPDPPRLSWLNIKTRASSVVSGNRAGNSGHNTEFIQALKNDAAFERVKLEQFKEGDEIPQ